jgi:hypothetical protein
MSAFVVRSHVKTTNLLARQQQQLSYQNTKTIMSLSSDENSDNQESSMQVATKTADGSVYDDEVQVSQIMVPLNGMIGL